MIFTPFLRQAISLLLGNQSKVMPVNKPGGSRGEPSRNKPTTANKSQSQRLTSIRSLGPKGWAPGPAGSGEPPEVLPLKITLPTEYTVPAVLRHYAAVRVDLCKRVRDGGQDAVAVIINARLTTQTPGRVRPTPIHVSIL